MHEIGIARDVWEKIKQDVVKNNIKSLSKVTIKVGEASGIEIDLLRHSLKDHIFPETVAENAELEIISDPVALKCLDCQYEITKEDIKNPFCPKCNGMDIEIKSGNSIYVEKIEGINK